MSPNPAVNNAATSISAPDTLSALQQSWTQAHNPEPIPEPAAPANLPLRESFLSLRDIPQITFDQARGAFTMTDPGLPGRLERTNPPTPRPPQQRPGRTARS